MIGTSVRVQIVDVSFFVPVILYGSETMIWREKESPRIRAVQMYNLSIRRIDRVPNAQIRVVRSDEEVG